MALIPKKTYSRKNYELHENEGKNVDPFDELLSSPLKQDVQFRPLSFWRDDVEKSEQQKNTSRSKYKLSESDYPLSPYQGTGERKRKNVRGKGSSKKQGEKSLPHRSSKDCLKSDSFFKLDKSFSTPCLYKRNNAVKTTRKNYNGYVTLRRHFNVTMPCTSATNDISSHRRERECDLSKKKESLNDCEWKNENEFNVIQDESTVCEEFEKCYETPKELFESLVLDYHFCDRTYVIESERTLLKDAEKEFITKSDSLLSGDVSDLTILVSDMTISKSNETVEENSLVTSSCESFQENDSHDSYHDSLQSGDISDLTNLVSDMTISIPNETLQENTLVNSSCESLEEKCTSGLQSKALTVNEDKKEDCSTYSDECRNVTRRRPGRDPSQRERIVSDLKSVIGDKHSETFTLTKIEESLNGIEYDSESSFKVPTTLNSSEYKNEISFDSSRFSVFAQPISESTRFIDDMDDKEVSSVSLSGKERMTDWRETLLPDAEHSVVLKTGKKWQRSMSVLKQIQNGNFSMDVNKVKGRRFDKFLQETLEMQPDNSFMSTSVSDMTICKGTYVNRTAKVIPSREASLEKPSLFMTVLGVQVEVGEDSVEEENRMITPRDFILHQCGQEDALPFEEYFNERTLKNCKKIGEGVYGEVFMYNSDTVLKIIPIEGQDRVNGEPQKKFEEILSEVVIASELSNLRKGVRYRTSGFSEMKRCWCVVGKYPRYLLELWDEYDQSGNGSENDSPVMFGPDQLYIILELANGGKDLEAFLFNSAEQSLSIFIQTAYSLAAAEKAFEFEHRDLHWGNLLIARTKDKFMSVVLDGVEYKIPTKGVKVSIIDFTLSRMHYEGCCIFNDLSVDPSLFTSQGDYQFEIYRMMQRELTNDWSLFKPKNNLFWLHYIVDKMLKMVVYKNKNTQVHKKSMKELKLLESVILEYDDSTDFVISQQLIRVR